MKSCVSISSYCNKVKDHIKLNFHYEETYVPTILTKAETVLQHSRIEEHARHHLSYHYQTGIYFQKIP